VKLRGFQIWNYRTIVDSGWVDVDALTTFVGQNECGKSNLLRALAKLNSFDGAKYDLNTDWPIDFWAQKDAEAIVCRAEFSMDAAEIEALLAAAPLPGQAADDDEEDNEEGEVGEAPRAIPPPRPASGSVFVERDYKNIHTVDLPEELIPLIGEEATAVRWVLQHLPKCVYMEDYAAFTGAAEIPHLKQKLAEQGGKLDKLKEEEKTILIVLELAAIKIDDIAGKENTPEGRRLRGFDTNAASRHLSQTFGKKWKQKRIKFDIRVDGPTLNVYVEDEGLDAFVPLEARSRGFQWFVSFVWRFTYASRGAYKDCILLLDEPGIHLHHAGHRDLLEFFESLAQTNTVLFTTHLATMLDPGFPERVRIVEVHEHHTSVKNGIVSSQPQPMMVIEAQLGLTGSMSGLLGMRQNLIVEGGYDAMILQKLSALLIASGGRGLSDRIYLLPAQGAAKTPMYAAFMVGNGWDAGVLLDSDDAGLMAKQKISELFLDRLAADQRKKFRVLMLGSAAKSSQNEFAIEDLFPTDFYLACVNEAYGTNLTEADLPVDGSEQIAKRVEAVLKARGRAKELDKNLVGAVLQRRFVGMKAKDDLPHGTAERAAVLFDKINEAFAS